LPAAYSSVVQWTISEAERPDRSKTAPAMSAQDIAGPPLLTL
jgi:hypothetical protein